MRLITQNAYFLLTLTSLCWAGNAVAGQLARGHVSPQVLTSLRWLIVSAVLIAIYHADLRRYWTEIKQHRWQLIAMSVVGFTGFNSLFYIASTQTTGVNIGILQGSIPVFVMLGAYFAFRTKVTGRQILGVVITLSGVVIVAAKGDLERLLGLQFNPGDLIMLFACTLYSAYTVALKRRPPLPALVFMTVLSIIAVFASIPPLLIEIALGAANYPDLQGWLVTFFVALFPSFIAQITFMRGVELIGPGRAGIFVNLVPIFAAFLAVMILSEPFKLYHAAALGLVLGGIALAERKKLNGAGKT